MPNLDRLISAGIIPSNNTLSKDDITTINSLDPNEVDALISLKSKLGDDFLKRNAVASPNCFL
jgi:hypothetical protein